MSITNTTTEEAAVGHESIQYKTAPGIGHYLKNNENEILKDLERDGYAIVKGAITREKAIQHQQRAFEWLESFNTKLDISKPETWTKKNLPVHSEISTFAKYAVSHEKFFWDLRLEPGVLEAFEKVWGTDELLVSFDALNVTFPNREDHKSRAPWPHVDQSPFRRGLHCVQGIINLSEAGPDDGGLVVYPGSHKYTEAFFETQTTKATWIDRDFNRFSEEELAWFKERGAQCLKICASPGDLILWDSRLIHYGSEPSKKSNTIRTVVYVAYSPAKFATPETLKVKKGVLERFEATTHWPHDNIRIRPNEAVLEDGTPDPRNRTRPLEEPVYTDQVLKLAGALPYH